MFIIVNVMIKKEISQTPIPVIRALKKLGRDIYDARRRRHIPTSILAQRASISRTTLNKIEKGDPGVSAGILATVLFSLGMIDRFADLSDVKFDAIGLELEEEYLPKRIRLPKSKSLNSKPPGKN